MTEKQQCVLDFVRAHHAEHGRGPTQQAIATHLGSSSKGHVNAALQALVRAGYLIHLGRGHGNYAPIAVGPADLADVSTQDLRAELDRRQAEGAGR